MSDAFGRFEAAVAGRVAPPEGGSGDAEAALLGLLKSAVTTYEQAVPAFISEVEALNPPQEVASAHRDFVEGLRSDYQRISDLASALRETDTLDEARSAVEASEPALSRVREPCRKLQAIAQQQGISIQLLCEE